VIDLRYFRQQGKLQLGGKSWPGGRHLHLYYCLWPLAGGYGGEMRQIVEVQL